MMERIENRMVVDSEWDEIEYGVKHCNMYQRKRQAYDEAEREERYGSNGNSKSDGRRNQMRF